MIKSFLRITRNYTQHRYHKFKVTRLPGQEVVFMLKDVTTVGDLYQHIQHHFPQPNTQLFAGSDFTSKIGEITVTEEMKKDSQQVTNTPFLPIFLSNDLYIYQTHQNKAHVLYGIECLQLNFTNNRNLPQTIQNGIINLDQEWQTTKTISQALQMPKRADPAVLQQEKQQLSRVLGKTIANIQTMTQVKLHNPVNNFINRMSLLMGTNWVFLYILTFGYYGWDVGEPISYLTSIAVELMAMLRWYDLEQRLNNQFQTNQGRYIGMMNLLAQKRTQRWMHCYLRRQLN